jgi:hypothetical protein
MSPMSPLISFILGLAIGGMVGVVAGWHYGVERLLREPGIKFAIEMGRRIHDREATLDGR